MQKIKQEKDYDFFGSVFVMVVILVDAFVFLASWYIGHNGFFEIALVSLAGCNLIAWMLALFANDL